MPKTPPPSISLAFTDLRTRTGLNQQEAAEKLGMAKSSLSGLETGARNLKRDQADDLLEKLGQETEALDVLLTAHALIDEMADPLLSGDPASPLALTPEERRSFARSAMSGAALAGRAIYEELVRKRREVIRAEARRQAEEVWSRLEKHTRRERFDLVEGSIREARSWALVELLCRRSLRAASHEPHVAVHLAELACHVAERMAGDARSVAHAQSCAWAHLGNARRVASDLPGGERAFARAWEHWPAGEGSDLDLLPKWRLFDFEASLRRDQRKFPEALELHDQAFAVCGGGEAAGRVLLKQGATQVVMEDVAGALRTFEKARPVIEETPDRRLHWTLFFNIATALDQIGRHEEVQQLLPRVRQLTIELQRKIDLFRLDWLEARVLLSRGQRPEAMAGFEKVRRSFTSEGLAFDTALCSLEQSILLLEKDRPAEVRALAWEMGWIFEAQDVHREALAALKIFCEAARKREATLDLARQVLDFLKRVQRDPSLCFEKAQAGEKDAPSSGQSKVQPEKGDES
ncbi:MAG TPA: helix-turn-helix transcriptional regulator [Thermoanaerobaculia bacterium]|nr:helix-turn-helix transcriptional regulator [Thermoanaerobaculia bacterium]